MVHLVGSSHAFFYIVFPMDNGSTALRVPTSFAALPEDSESFGMPICCDDYASIQKYETLGQPGLNSNSKFQIADVCVSALDGNSGLYNIIHSFELQKYGMINT